VPHCPLTLGNVGGSPTPGNHPQRPHWLAGAPGFEPGNGGIKIQVVRVIYQWTFRKIAEIHPQTDQEVSCHFGMAGRGAGFGRGLGHPARPVIVGRSGGSGPVTVPASIAVFDNLTRTHGASRPLETSVRGVFAIGDVRSGSVKRVAAAVVRVVWSSTSKPPRPQPHCSDHAARPRRRGARNNTVCCGAGGGLWPKADPRAAGEE
jgi:hypothetical protein